MRVPPGELSIDPEADERLAQVTEQVGMTGALSTGGNFWVIKLGNGWIDTDDTLLHSSEGQSVVCRWFIAQMAACVRLLTRIFRRIALT